MKLYSSSRKLTLLSSIQRKGFSLIELMVAMAMGLVLLAGLFYIYINASNSSRSQGALALMQTNARYAFEFMGVDIRMAGFTGSQDLTNVVGIPNPATLKGLFDLANPLVGYSDTNPPNVCATVNTIACYLANTDSLTVVRVDTANKYALSNYNTTGLSFTLTAWPTSDAPQAGEVFVAADYTHAAVFQVGTVDSAAKTVSYGSGGSPGNTSTNLGGTTGFHGGINALAIYRLSGISYYIGRNPVGEPALYRDKLENDGTTLSSSAQRTTNKGEELVQGVEDMQIAYGVDTSADVTTRSPLPGDGSVDGYWTANEVNSNAMGMSSSICTTSGAYWKCVLSVRITLTLVSGQNEKVGTTGDKLLRKTFVNTIAIRNRLL